MIEEETMELRSLMVPAAEAATRIVRAVPAGGLDGPTPCLGWEVRGLINHMIFWSARGEYAAHKQQPPAEPAEEHDFTADGDWAGLFAAHALKTAEAWASSPEAWEGNTSLTGSSPGMQSAYIGGMIFGECIIHGWDLAVATGQRPEFAPELVEAAYEGLVPIAEMGRQYEAFGAEVPVPETAPLIERLLGLSGRDPYWTP
jgi:uncharacterized protein (TIGR03086 family)